MNLLKTLFNRQWAWVTCVVILGMLVLGRLGIWQLDRLQQRRASNALLIAAMDAQPFELTSAPLPSDLTSLKNHFVTVNGRYDFANQVLVLLQTWNGSTGANLLTPMVLDDGQTAVLVNRGWIPDAELGNLSQFDTPDTTSVKGYIALSETLSRQTTAPKLGLEWYRVDITGLQKQMPYRLLPVYVIQSSPPEANTELPYHYEREIDLSEGPHMSYAMQWFAFMTMLGVGYVFFVYNRMSPAAPPAP